MIFPIGDSNTAYADYFHGNSYLARISDSQIPFSNVTFEPRCRNNWHIHRSTSGGGQMLIGVAGRGWYQEEGKQAVEIRPGTVIHIPVKTAPTNGSSMFRTTNTTISYNHTGKPSPKKQSQFTLHTQAVTVFLLYEWLFSRGCYEISHNT